MPGVVNINESDIYPKKRTTRGATESEKGHACQIKEEKHSEKMQKEWGRRT